MKRLIVYTIVVSMVSVPAAGASVFGTTAGTGDEEVLTLHLNGEDDPAGRGYAASLLAEGSGSRYEEQVFSGTYSPVKAGAASFLLPGLGQLKLGRKLRSKIFFGLEGAAWIAIGSFLWQGYARENAYEDYAVAFAGLRGTSYSDEFYEAIGDYISNEGPGGYNEAVRREARDLYYPDTEAMESYYDANKYVGDMSWHWRSNGAFVNYGILRSGSRSSYRRALYSAMFALALRIVSTVDAVRIARGASRAAEEHESSISLDLEHQPGGLTLSFRKSF